MHIKTHTHHRHSHTIKNWAKYPCRCFSKENTQIANRYMKRYPTFLDMQMKPFWKMQMKPTMRYHFTSVRMAIMEKKKKCRQQEWVGTQGQGTQVSENEIWYSHYGKQCRVSSKNLK